MLRLRSAWQRQHEKEPKSGYSKLDTIGSKFKVPSSSFKVHAVSVILSGVYGVEGFSRRNILIIVLWIDASTSLSMTETAWERTQKWVQQIGHPRFQVQGSKSKVQGSKFMPSLSSWAEFTEWRICKRQQNNCQAHVHRCFLRQHDKDSMNLKQRLMALNLEPWTWNLLFGGSCSLSLS